MSSNICCRSYLSNLLLTCCCIFWVLLLSGVSAAGAEKHRGCYVDDTQHRLLDSVLEIIPTTLTPSICTNLCFQRGYPFSGARLGTECHCGFQFPSIHSKAIEAECSSICSGDINKLCGGDERLDVYETGISFTNSRPRSIYLGCYKDHKTYAHERDNNLLKGFWDEYKDSLSPRLCDDVCYRKGFLYFGMTLGNVCFCGDQRPPQNARLNETSCYQSCSGEHSQKCGGSWELSVYATGISDMPVDGKYLGCGNVTGNKLNPEYQVRLPLTNSPRRCINICSQLGYGFAGIENRAHCYCSKYSHPPLNIKVDDEECDKVKCPGDPSEKCGADERVKVFSTFASDLSAVMLKLPDRCTPSVTTVNGRPACKNDIVFQSDFQSINTSIFKYTVKMASKPSYEFVTYGTNEKNSYVKNNTLFIRPTVLPEEDVKNQQLTIEGCTGEPGTQECTRRAMGFFILPPIQSTRLTTENSISFRYGVIQIEAKFPSGDWIVPSIWLEPKNPLYGENLASGRIQLARVRGNKDLKCSGTALGSSILDGGCYFQADGTLRKVTYDAKKTDWTKDWHNITLVWTPDDLSFFIDSEFMLSATDNRTKSIKEHAKVPKSSGIRNTGTKLTPFDKEFFLTIGVSVGGLTDFPDNKCVSNGVSKPWMNNEAKAMLKFFQGRSSWESTWKDEETALRIQNIAIKAL